MIGLGIVKETLKINPNNKYTLGDICELLLTWGEKLKEDGEGQKAEEIEVWRNYYEKLNSQLKKMCANDPFSEYENRLKIDPKPAFSGFWDFPSVIREFLGLDVHFVFAK